MVILTVSMPASAAEKILKDPEAFKKYLEAQGFPVVSVELSQNQVEPEKEDANE